MRSRAKTYFSFLVLIGCATTASAQPAEIAPACADAQKVRVGMGVAPEYTESARRARIKGTVKVRVTLDDTGRVADAVAENPLPMGLDTVARDAARQWRFSAPYPPKSCSTFLLEFHFDLGPRAEGIVPLGIVVPPISVKVVGELPLLDPRY